MAFLFFFIFYFFLLVFGGKGLGSDGGKMRAVTLKYAVFIYNFNVTLKKIHIPKINQYIF